jgi:hypothetical protein
VVASRFVVDIEEKTWHWQIFVPWIIPLQVTLVVVAEYYCYRFLWANIAVVAAAVVVATAIGAYVSPNEEGLTSP